MESFVASTVSTHVKDHNLKSSQQWAYRKGHSTELLLVKMTEAWRRALDRKLVVGVVFVDFRKVFDSISRPVLLHKLQGLGVAGDIWLWIKNYLANRSQTTSVNGCTSEAMPVKGGVPQGSVLGPTLFSLFCNDLPDITDSGEGEICMHADDTTIYAAAPTPDGVAVILNNTLSKLYERCCRNQLTPHPGKTEFMFLGHRTFVGPLQKITLGESCIKLVRSTQMFGRRNRLPVEMEYACAWVD